MAAVEVDLGETHADLTSHDTFVSGVPHGTFKRLRDEDPVSWTPEVDGSGFWSVTRYADVQKVAGDYQTFSAARGIRLEEMSEEEIANRRTLMETDPPEHTRLRRLVNRGFTPRVVLSYEAAIRELAANVLDDALPLGTFDYVTEVARKLPMRMLGRLLGIPDSDGEWLVQKGDAMIANTDPEFTDHPVGLTDTDEYRLLPFRSPAAIEIFEYAEKAARERRENPGDDIISRLLSRTIDGEPLTDLEFKNFFALLIAAGNDTTRYSLAAGLHRLMHEPGVMDHWRADPGVGESIVEEIFRTTTVTMHFRRTATVDTELSGTPIRAGDKVVMWFVSANHDERQFPDPFRFDPLRTPNDHVTFGGRGPHFCMGAWLARLEVRVVFEELLKRTRSIEPAGDIERLRSNFISGIKHLPVTVEMA